jgi:hypothetical protein
VSASNNQGGYLTLFPPLYCTVQSIARHKNLKLSQRMHDELGGVGMKYSAILCRAVQEPVVNWQMFDNVPKQTKMLQCMLSKKALARNIMNRSTYLEFSQQITVEHHSVSRQEPSCERLLLYRKLFTVES